MDGRREPGAYQRVTLQNDDDGVDAYLLEAGGHQERSVDTRAELLGQHLVGESQPLAELLEVGRWRTVDDALLAQRLVEGSHLLAHAVAVLRLVLVERRRAGQLLQLSARVDQYP